MNVKNFILCLCLIGVCTVMNVNAGTPQVIELSETMIYSPNTNPIPGTGGMPVCNKCFSATITDNMLNVVNEADELVNVVVTDLLTYEVVVSAQVSGELEEQLSSGLYLLEIYPQTYAPMEGYFEVE